MEVPLAGMVLDCNLENYLVSCVLRLLEVNMIVNTLVMIS